MDARAAALAEELGSQLARMKGAGPKLKQFLSMMVLDPPERAGRVAASGATPEGARPVPFDRVRQVIEQDLGTRVGRVFEDIEPAPFALASLGQVHRARTTDGERVAVKVQHPGVAEAVEADLRNLGLVSPILKRLAPRLDVSGVLSEMRERVSEELDYEVEAQHQRRLGRLLRGHPDVRIPRVHTELSTRRVLVTEYVHGLTAEAIKRLGDAERDRVGEIAFRLFIELAWREGVVAADPHPDHCILCPDGRLCLLDFGLVRDLDAARLEGERELMAALLAADEPRLLAGLAAGGYLPAPAAVDPGALLEHLAVAGEWLLTPGFRRIDPTYVARILELGYSPRSPLFPLLRRMSIPAPTLLLRRMEVQLLSLLGELRAGADWAAIAEKARDEAATRP